MTSSMSPVYEIVCSYQLIGSLRGNAQLTGVRMSLPHPLRLRPVLTIATDGYFFALGWK